MAETRWKVSLSNYLESIDVKTFGNKEGAESLYNAIIECDPEVCVGIYEVTDDEDAGVRIQYWVAEWARNPRSYRR